MNDIIKGVHNDNYEIVLDRREAIKNFDVVNNFELQSGNGIVLCMCKEIVAYDDNNYMIPIEYIQFVQINMITVIDKVVYFIYNCLQK